MLFKQIIYALSLPGCLLLTAFAFAVDSGSSGSDGDLAPTADMAVNLPADGLLNYNTVNIPVGVTVRFVRNQSNTPIYILVKGDAVIDGNIDISGVDGGVFSLASPPGGFAGGLPRGEGLLGGHGKGPGGGGAAAHASYGGAGGGYAFGGKSPHAGVSVPGRQYGSVALQPLWGGSGGGAGRVETGNPRGIGFAGGSGGGALLLAVSGTLTLNGSIVASGGNGESETAGIYAGTMGGGGSGGAVRIVATGMSGGGVINIAAGKGGVSAFNLGKSGAALSTGGDGSVGRVRIEVEQTDFSGQTIPPSVAVPVLPQPIFLAALPTIRIAAIAGQAVPVNPSGFSDVIMPANTPNPVTVEFEATGIPENVTVLVTVDRAGSQVTTVTSTGLTGAAVLTATAKIHFAAGATTLLAAVTFSVSATQAQNLSAYTNGEAVERVALSTTMGGGSEVVLITAAGRSVKLSSLGAAFSAR